MWSPVNKDTRGTCHSVRVIRVSVHCIKQGLIKKVTDTWFIDIKTKAGEKEEGKGQRLQHRAKDVKLVWYEKENLVKLLQFKCQTREDR